jgi:uncharacterized protein (UPF0276 family)
MKNFNLKALGSGAGLRHEHFDDIIAKKPPFHWFEVIAEDFMNVGGAIRKDFDQIRSLYPIISHGVCLAIGSTDPLDMKYLKNLKTFVDLIDSPWISDHLSFTMVDHTNLVDLIPLPFTTEAVNHIAERIRIVQDFMEKPFLIENVTRYITVSDREMGENEFLSSILEKANCGLLLDVTNVFLNGKFHDYDPYEFISSIPYQRIGQIHLAGWEPDTDGTIIDSHDAPVPPEVWDLFKRVIALTGPTSVLIEWDASIPPVEQLLRETQIADALMNEVLNPRKETLTESHTRPTMEAI